MIAVTLAAPVAFGMYGKYKYDDYKKRPIKEQFALENVNAAALYFPQTVTFDGQIDILDIKAIDPNLVEKLIDDTPNETPNDTNAKDNEIQNNNNDIDNDDNTEQKNSEEPTTKQRFKSFSKQGLKWFNKMKDEATKMKEEAIQKIDEAKKEYDIKKKAKAEQKQDDNIDEKQEENIIHFSDNVHLQLQVDIPCFFRPYIINSEVIKSSQDVQSIITSNMALKFKWKDCQCYIHENCMYVLLDDEWRYVSFYNDTLQFIPLTMPNKNNFSYFYFCDKNDNYLIGRCVANNNVNTDQEQKEAEQNFVNAYIASKTEMITKNISVTEHYRKLWIMNENMLKARKDTLDNNGNNAAMYHRNEFELDLKLLIKSEEDIRSDYWGKFEEVTVCDLTKCNNKFGKFGHFVGKHHCYICGKVICDECGKNKFTNPVNNLQQRACNDCFSIFYPKMNDKNDIFNLDLNDLLVEYNEKKENKFKWNKQEESIINECGILSHWIYDGHCDDKLIEILGFKQVKLVLYGQENQQVQYAIVESLKHKNTIYLVFRGSYDFMDWMTNFQTNPLKLSEIGFKVHSGMYCALQQHAFDIIVNNLCKNIIIGSNKRLIITGHSLGGGYSVLSAMYILAQKNCNVSSYFYQKDKLKIVTFGAPLVLEKDINKNNKIGAFLEEITVNFINQFDVVPRIGEGISLEYIKKLTEKSIDDSMRKIWGLKQMDSMFNLKIQEKIQNHLFERDDIKNIDKVQKEIYGAIGTYYLLMNKDKPAQVIKVNKKKSVFVRQLKGICLLMPDPQILLSLLPKRSGLFANHMLYDHFMNNYLTPLYFMNN